MKINYIVKFVIASLMLLFVSCEAAQEFVTLVQPKVSIEDVESPTGSVVTATLVPNESSASFFYAIAKSSDRELFLSEKLEGIEYATQSEPLQVSFDGLDTATEYTIFACSKDSEGVNGSLASFIVKSNEVEFAVEQVYVGVESAAFSIEVNSSVNRVDYFFGEQGLSDDFKSDKMPNIEYIIEQTYKCCNYYDLDQNSSYSFYAKAYDRRGGVSDVVEIPITTYTKDAIPAVELTDDGGDIYKNNFTITPNDLCGHYYLLASEKGSYSPIYDNPSGYAGNVYGMMLAWRGENWGVATISGEHKFYMENFALASSLNYEIFILSCDKDDNPVALQHYDITTKPGEATGAAELTIEPLEITSNSASFTITPNEHTLGVLFQTFTKSSYDSYWSYDLSELHAWYLDRWLAAVVNNSVDVPWNYGSESFVYSEKDLNPDFYYVVAIPVNGSGVDVAGGWGDLVMYEYEIVAE